MTVNIYDTANEMERNLRQIPEYLTLKEAVDAVNADAEAKALFDEFKQVSSEMEGFIQQGKTPTEDDQKRMMEVYGKVSSNEKVSQVLAKQQALSIIIQDINNILMTPISELYK
jgi:cell fate (sporulation/competence/biofilm development) regulator YlbF (YheA/YmcA/DUF963 family)